MTKTIKEDAQANAKSEGNQDILEDDKEEDKETVNLDAIKKDIETSSHQSKATVVVEVPKPHTEAVDSTNPLSPVKPTPDQMKKAIYPPNFTQVNEFVPLRFESLENKKEEGMRAIHIRGLDPDQKVSQDA